MRGGRRGSVTFNYCYLEEHEGGICYKQFVEEDGVNVIRIKFKIINID